MRRNVGMLATLALISSLGALQSAQAALLKTGMPSIASTTIAGGDIAAPRVAPTYSCGFEEEDGFLALGTLDGQAGWAQTGTNLAFGQVSDINPFAGVQHYRQIKDTTTAPGSSLKIGQTPDLGDNAKGVGHFQYSVETYIHTGSDNDTDADFHFLTYGRDGANSGEFISSYIDFFYEDGDGDSTRGEIWVWAGGVDEDGFLINFVNTGVEYARDAYKTLTVSLDNNNDVMDVYYDGALIYSDQLPSSLTGADIGNTIDMLRMGHDNYLDFADTGEFIDYDNVLITPEPATLALLGLAAFGLIRRRR